MLGEKSKTHRDTIQFASPEMLVPKEHLLRKIDAAINFDDIYDMVRPLYCLDNGRPSIDPVVLFKIVMVQHIYGIPSLRQTIAEINMNIAYRWFIGYDLSEAIPHFATVSYNFRHRFTPDTIETVFKWILGKADKEGYLSPDVAFVDGTHIKANANINKRRKKDIEKKARSYERQLREEINEDREAHGKKPFDDDPPCGSAEEGKAAETITVTESTTDPESGVFHKGEHKRCFAYSAQTVCDKNGFILAAAVNAGNMHDSVAFDSIYRDVTERFPELKWIVADAGYKTPWICKRIFDDGRIPSLPYTRPMTKRGFFKKYEYVYDEYFDCVLCPENRILKYSTTNRNGYREYKSDPNICRSCPSREKCTGSKQCQKVVTLHVWNEYLERAEDVRHSWKGKELYALRSQTIERVFADAKEKHGMRYTLLRGLKQVRNWVKLKFAAMNLKKLAIKKWKEAPERLLLRLYFAINVIFAKKHPAAA